MKVERKTMRDFRELKVWQKGIVLFEALVKDVEGFPKTDAAKIIANQIIRSISSITANIAEGYGRRKGKEFEHYLYIARGSANETIDWLEKLRRLRYIDENGFESREQLCQEIRAMLSKMIDGMEK